MSRVEVLLRMSPDAMQAAQAYGRKHKLSFDEAVSSMILNRREEADRVIVTAEIAATLEPGTHLYWIAPGRQEVEVIFEKRDSSDHMWVHGKWDSLVIFDRHGIHSLGLGHGWLEIASNL